LWAIAWNSLQMPFFGKHYLVIKYNLLQLDVLFDCLFNIVSQIMCKSYSEVENLTEICFETSLICIVGELVKSQK
jgi:hypothetical protein